MKQIRIIYVMMVVSMMTGCSMDRESEELGGLTPINLGNTVVTSDVTRAAINLNEGYLPANAKITAKISKASEDNYTAYNYLVVNSDGKMTPASATIPCYPADNSAVKIAAYYPATAGTSFTVKSDQTSDADYMASDLMFAYVASQTPTTSAVPLAFAHQMAKIMVNASPASGTSITISGIKLKNIAPTVAFAQTSAINYASVSATGSTDIIMSNNGAALIPQQTINGTFLEVITSMGTATFALSKTFEAGHQYTLNISINSAAIGTTNTITGWTGDGTATLETFNSYAPSYVVAVDLGLSMKWANVNIGATSETDYGTYFAWGETKGFTNGGVNTKSTGFTWDNYWWGSGTNSLIKYCTNASNGTLDNKRVLELADDAARTNWGGGWRMPTEEDFNELMKNTNNEWVSNYNSTGIAGYIFRNKLDNTKYIFLPAAGMHETTGLSLNGTSGHYWSSSLCNGTNYPYYSIDMWFDNSKITTNNNSRCFGYTIRAVQ